MARGRRLHRSADATAGIWPVTRQIVLETGRNYSAVDAFEGQYKLAELKARADGRDAPASISSPWPTAPARSIAWADLEREPVLFNTHLGHYTNFVNFFGLAALALPAGFRPDGMPFGITLIGATHGERALLAFAARWQRECRCRSARPRAICRRAEDDPVPSPRIACRSPWSARI